MHNSTDALKSYGNIRDIVNEANGGNADASAWVGRRRNAEPRKNDIAKTTEDKPKAQKPATKREENHQAIAFSKEEPKLRQKSEKSEKKKQSKAVTQAQKNNKPQHPPSAVIAPTDTGTLPDWNEFLKRLNERKSMKDKGLKRTVYMPDYIIDSLQAGFGRHSSDVLCILAEWFIAANRKHRKNILRYISDKSGIL